MRKVIAFVTNGLVFNGNSLKEKSLGGSESAMIQMAKELARLGNDVYVYCDCDKPGIYDNVVYSHFDKFIKGQYPQLDVCVVSRLQIFLQQPIDSNLTIFWLHDVPDSTRPLHNQTWQVDQMFCMSQYQIDLYETEEPLLKNRFWLTKNGVDSNLVKNTKILPFDEKKNDYIWASRPERGLKTLLNDYWDTIIQDNPNAKLHICGYDNNQELEQRFYDQYKEIDEIASTKKNIIKHGNLTKKQYYELLGKCGFMFYPTKFEEISCINAIEAQAMGCLVIATNNYALKETVKSKTLIDGKYNSKEYKKNAHKLLNQFKDKIKFEKEIESAKNIILNEYSWGKIAKEWDNHINQLFTNRYNNNRHQILNNLIYKSDIYAAWKLTGDSGYRKMLDMAFENNRNYKTSDINVYDNVNVDEVLRFQTVTNSLANYIEKDKKYRVLDLGCYIGMVSKAILNRFDDNIEKIYAYDANQQALDKFKELYQNDKIEFILDDALNVHEHDINADIIIVGELLEHIEEYIPFLNNLMKVANPNALVLFTVPYGPWESISLKDNKTIDKNLFHVHHFEFSDILQIFKDTEQEFFITRPYAHQACHRGYKLDNWIFGFKYTKPVTFYEVDYQLKALKTRPYFSIATCMIVKDEEINLARALESIKNISDEIIIVDTGSIDRTKEIAKRYTDKVYDFKWNGSFEDARNYSISKTKCDWILWIDADEELQEYQILGKLAENEFYGGIIIEQRQIDASGHNLNETQYPTRLIRNNRGYKFYGVIHELPGVDENTLIRESLNQQMCYIIHYGYSNRLKNIDVKLRRNYDLLKTDIEKYPDRWVNKMYLMRDSYFILIREADISGRFNHYYINEIIDVWDKNFRNHNDTNFMYVTSKTYAYKMLQHLYQLLIDYEIKIDNKLPFKKTVEFIGDKIGEFWFRDEKEYKWFLKEHKLALKPSSNNKSAFYPVYVAEVIKSDKEATVPCNGCVACCKNADIFLTPDEVISGNYVMEWKQTGKIEETKTLNLDKMYGAFKLPMKSSGDCYYLNDNKCSIYSLRPHACRQFDCRKAVKVTDAIKQAVINITLNKGSGKCIN